MTNQTHRFQNPGFYRAPGFVFFTAAAGIAFSQIDPLVIPSNSLTGVVTSKVFGPDTIPAYAYLFSFNALVCLIVTLGCLNRKNPIKKIKE